MQINGKTLSAPPGRNRTDDDEREMTVHDLLIILLAGLSLALAVLVWLAKRRERLSERYVDTDEW